jgi:cation-transporting P-type ATPase 13A2
LIRRFDFSSKLQRMSVIIKDMLSHSYKTYVKGSPEKIRELCTKESLPSNFDEILQIYTESGFRVLAVAYKNFDPDMTYMDTQSIQRDDVETELRFLGFLIMQNKLKPVTTSII